MTELPPHWSSLALGELCSSVEKVDPTNLGRDDFWYVDIGALEPSSSSLEKVINIPTANAPGRARQLIRNGDSIFATVRPYMKKVAYIPKEFDGQIASTGFCVLRPIQEKLHSKYLFYFLLSDQLLDQVLPLQRGVSYPAIRDNDLKNAHIPIPPIDEQNKIVELLEDHLSRLDAALADVKQAKTKAAQFRASVLNSIFFDYGSKGWPLYKAADLGKWITGSTPSSKVSDYVGSDVPFITPGDIIDGGEIADYSRMISNSGADSVRRLRSNSVHLVCIGATLGKVGIARFESTSNQQINALEANEEIVLPDFAMWLLASPAMQRELWDASSSTTVPILNKGNLEKIGVRVPAISEQIKALEEFDRARLTLEHLKKDFEIMLEKANGLRRSILQAAFTGQLTKEVVSV